MSNFYSAKKAGVGERISIALVMKLPPAEVFRWMKENHAEPEESVYMDMRREREDRHILDYCLYRRNDPLIDFSLAQYGCTSAVLKRVFKRCGASTRLAVLANPNGSVHVMDEDFWSKASALELGAFFSRPSLSGGLFTNLFERKHGFTDLSEDRHLQLVKLCSNHPRLKSEYSSTFMDGMDEYEYHRTFDAAWNLAKTVPLTKEWAWAINGLLGTCLPPIGNTNALETIARWNIPEAFKEGDPWYKRGPFFHARATLGNLLPQEDLVNNEDAALRVGFYRKFDPVKFPDLQAFFARDGEEFVNAAMYNQNLWKKEDVRRTLSSLCWKCPDPHSSMDMPNSYKGAEKHFEKLHPEWFVEEEWKDEQEEVNPTLEALVELQEKVRGLEASLAAYASKTPSGLGWWVVAALLTFHLFSKG